MSPALRLWPLWDFLFPPLCSYCGRTLDARDGMFCRQCWADAPVADPKKSLHTPNLNQIRAGFHFAHENMVRAAVHALKYDGFAGLAADMAKHLLPRIPTQFLEADVVWCPVPLHWSRKMSRGFNQSQILLEQLEQVTGHKSRADLLRRTRNTPSQTARSLLERRSNVKGAFALRPVPGPLPKSVLLIDDVITTGATINECATVLKAAGVQWVGALAFALTEIDLTPHDSF